MRAETPEARIATLQLELAATTQRSRQAILRFELGHCFELHLKDEQKAIKEYLGSFNLNPAFRPALFALIRIFERKRSFGNLARLYEAEGRTGTNASERTSAYLDRAIVARDGFDRKDEARRFFAAARAHEPESAALALQLEYDARLSKDRESLVAALAMQGGSGRPGWHRFLCLTEVAHILEDRGDVSGAERALRDATSVEGFETRSADLLSRFLQRHERFEDLVQVLKGLAARLESFKEDDRLRWRVGASTGQTFSPREQAAALYFEAATFERLKLGDADSASETLAKAVALIPEDIWLRHEQVLALEGAQRFKEAEQVAGMLAKLETSKPLKAAAYFLRAWAAEASRDTETMWEALEKALEADPESPTVLAMVDDLLAERGDHQARVQHLQAQSARLRGSAAALALWRAAHILTHNIGDFQAAEALYLQAFEQAGDDKRIPREAFEDAVRAGSLSLAEAAATRMFHSFLDDDERQSMCFDRLLLRLCSDVSAQNSAEPVPTKEQGDREALAPVFADGALERSLRDVESFPWGAQLRALAAASFSDYAELARLEQKLCDAAEDAHTKCAHLCACAWALGRLDKIDAAAEKLEHALDLVPGHAYAVSALVEIYRERGDGHRVVSLLRSAASEQREGGQAERSLLMAAAVAEAADDLPAALEALRSAASRDPQSHAPWWRMRRIAIERADTMLLREAEQALSHLEVSNGVAGMSTLSLGVLLDLSSNLFEEAETLLEKVMQNEELELSAASWIQTMPERATGSSVRLHAARSLALSSASFSEHEGFVREVVALARRSREGIDEAESWLRALATRQDEPALWTKFSCLDLEHLSTAPEDERAEHWIDLGQATSDPAAQADLVLQGIRTRMTSTGEEALEDSCILAQSVLEAMPDDPAAAVAADETLMAGDDAGTRAMALKSRMQHSDVENAPLLFASLGRTQLAANDSEAALQTLKDCVRRNPEDLASWESLRVAARRCQSWRDLMEACDRLADALDGELRAELLEEAGIVAMDQLEDEDAAAERFKKTLARDMRRPVAGGRLYEIFARRGENGALLDLLSRRLQVVEDFDEMLTLLYDQARLLRAESDLEGASKSLENLLGLDEAHVGAMALAAEVEVVRANWPKAVSWLVRLSEADIPQEQKRRAHIGAADLLEHHLGDLAAAFAQLEKASWLTESRDSELILRIVSLAERAGLYDEALRYLQEVSDNAPPEEAPKYRRRLALLAHRSPTHSASAGPLLRASIASDPADEKVAAALLASLSDTAEKVRIIDNFAHHVRARLQADVFDLDAIRLLRRAAEWRGDYGLLHRIHDLLLALGDASEEEQAAYRVQSRTLQLSMQARLTDEALNEIRGPEKNPMLGRLARLLSPVVARLDGLVLLAEEFTKDALVHPKRPHPAGQAVWALSATFGLESTSMYRGGDAFERVSLVYGKKEVLTWVLGEGVLAPLRSAQRFVVARQAFAAYDELLPWVFRSPPSGARLLRAIILVLQGSGRVEPGWEDAVAELLDALPRKRRKQAEQLAIGIGVDRTDLEGFCEQARLASLRAGLLASGSIQTVMHTLFAAAPSRRLMERSDEAAALAKFWLRSDVGELGRALGGTP